jgi:hypothetical protein
LTYNPDLVPVWKDDVQTGFYFFSKIKSNVSTGAKNIPAKNLYKLFGFQEINDIEVAPTIFITLFEKDCYHFFQDEYSFFTQTPSF